MRNRSFDLSGLREAYRTKALTPSEIVRVALARIDAYRDPAVWILRVPEAQLMDHARQLENHPDGPDRFPLYGIPFAIKDNIDCAGLPTTAACPDFAYTPQRNAQVVTRLVEAGAMLMGKTNLDQFATGLVGTRSPFGAPRCVFDERYVSGGSSSGSAVAVAAGLVSFALGTDTAGSGRVPASYNNIVGLKPTRGIASTNGIVPACKSLDCVSVFATTVGDADAVLRVMAAFDPSEPYSRRRDERTIPTAAFRIGVLRPEQREFTGDTELAALYDAAIMRAVSIGGTPVEIDYAPFAEAGTLLYDGPFVAERYAAIGAFLEAHPDSMDATVRTIIAGGRDKSATDAFRGEYRRRSLKHAIEKVWNAIDVLLLPTAPAHDMVAEIDADPIARNARLGRYTNFVNLLDCCAVAVPAFFRRNGLPFGVTLVAPAHCDTALAVISDRFHRAGSAGRGLLRDLPLPESSALTMAAGPQRGIRLFVVGAHLTGMPLNRELTELGAQFVAKDRTDSDYRLFALAGTVPPKPGMIREPGFIGPGIPGEIWEMSLPAFGQFVARIPAPLGIGKIVLADGSAVSGFLCEAHAIRGATDITEMGGWRAYIAQRTETGHSN